MTKAWLLDKNAAASSNSTPLFLAGIFWDVGYAQGSLKEIQQPAELHRSLRVFPKTAKAVL